jgi:hypothetical protein
MTGRVPKAWLGLARLILVMSWILLLPLETAMAQAKDDVTARNEATVIGGFDAWKNGTGSPTICWTMMRPGRSSAIRWSRGPIRAARTSSAT